MTRATGSKCSVRLPAAAPPSGRDRRWSWCGVAIVAVLLTLGGAAPAEAQARFGLRAGVWMDDGDPMVGVDVLLPLDRQWSLDPSLEYVDGDRFDLLVLSGDVLYDLELDTRATAWVGAGLAILYRDIDPPHHDDGTETDLGLDLLAGIGVETSSGLHPYVQAKAVLSDDSSAVVVLGLRF